MQRYHYCVFAMGCFLGATGATAAPTSADLIVRNADVYTVDPAKPHATAIAIAGGRYVAVGADSDVAAYKGPNTRELDLHGRFVLPGFIDSHTHIQEGGKYVSGVQLRDARTVAEVQRRVIAYAKAHPDRKWILGEAWSYGYPDMKDGAPTRQMLDAAVADRPVLLGSGMAHAGWINTKAMEMLKLTAATPDPTGGVFVRDKQGVPTGWLKESAYMQVMFEGAPASQVDKREIMRNAMAEAAKFGVTRLVSCGGDFDTLPLLHEWEQQGKLLTRFSISQWVRPGELTDKFYSEVTLGHRQYTSDLLRVDAVKFIEDGVIESHTAFMPEGYQDVKTEKGMSFWNSREQRDAVVKLNKLGIQVYTHAIGDGAIRQTLDAYEAAEKELGPQDLRNRIEHYESPYPTDINRLVKLHAIASMQPSMIYPKDQWMGMEGLWQRYAGDKRSAVAFPVHSVLAQGGHVAFGTDWPVVDLNPLLGVRNAVLRQSYDGEPAGGWVAAEKISLEDSIRLYTLGSAYAAHREKDEGSIQIGKLADFVVLSNNLLTAAPNQIQDVRVMRTFLGGRQVYEAGTAK